MSKCKAYKVIEERMSPSGRIEYLTLPLYKPITEDEIKGKTLFKPKETMEEWMLRRWGIEMTKVRTHSDRYVHAFLTYESALDYMQEHFKGYTYTRPVIYECEVENTDYPSETDCSLADIGFKIKCLSLRFVRPISQMVNFKVTDYVEMQKPERKKTYGFIYDESEINGDVEQEND